MYIVVIYISLERERAREREREKKKGERGGNREIERVIEREREREREPILHLNPDKQTMPVGGHSAHGNTTRVDRGWCGGEVLHEVDRVPKLLLTPSCSHRAPGHYVGLE